MTTLAWVAVAEKIRREIVNGKSGPNGELDTEAELCRRFATSRITVRRALAELRADGLITSRRGSGTRAVVPPTPPVSLVVTTGSISANPIAPIRTGVRWRTLRPTGELVAALRRAGRDEVSKGHWLRLTYGQRANGVLFDEATVWFSPRTVPFVSRQDVAVGPTAKLIEDAGVALGRAIQTVSSDWNERRAQLGEAPQACIDLTLERVMLTADDNIAFVSIHRHRSTLASFRIDLPTTNQHGDAQLILAALSWREETPFEVRSNRVSEAHGE
jgi:GntR family transcriptional regulator